MFDSAGVLIISVLIALFGFLTSRAWKLKTAILKWVTVTLRSMLHILLF